MSKKTKLVIKLLIIFVLTVAVIVLGKYCFEVFQEKLYHGDGQNQSQARKDTIVFEGKKYKYNYDLRNVLFIGIDNVSEIILQDHPGTAGQADCIMILSINDKEKKAQILQISRDTMTEVDVFDRSGEYYIPIEAQIATQYAYGDGREGSCNAMMKTVRELLYDIPVMGYITMDIAGIPIINDYVGGVTITIPEDYTEIDEAFVSGATLTLTGKQAERYVRYRNQSVVGSNSLRMQRQVQYIPALVEKFSTFINDDDADLEEFYEVLEPYMLTDLDVDDIAELSEYDWSVENVSYVPGEVVVGEKYEEFYINEEEFQKIMIKMFYK